jgi:hypothetical protein
MVSVGEILDPVNYRGGGQTITSRTRRVDCPVDDGRSVEAVSKYAIHTFYVEDTWESFPIGTPTSSVGDEPIGLSGARSMMGESKVVCAANKPGFGGAAPLRREILVLEGWRKSQCRT